MNIKESNAGEYKTKLRNYSQVSSMNRLSDLDHEHGSSLTAGGDDAYLAKDSDGDVMAVQETDKR